MSDLSMYFSAENESLKPFTKNPRKHRPLISRPNSLYINSTSKDIFDNYENSDYDANITLKSKCNNHTSRTRGSLSCSNISSNMPHILPPEMEEGNIEYKRKLVNPTPDRFEHLISQMQWRINEGGGKAIYRLGVDDDGHVCGLKPAELDSSLNTLERMTKRLNATLSPLRERIIMSPNLNLTDLTHVKFCKAVEFLIEQIQCTNQKVPDLCLAVVGGMDAGKSTLIGILTGGKLDNGRGKARLNLFRHLHEVQSGRTSSLSSELLGFDADGKVINYTHSAGGHLYRRSVDEIVRVSSNLITLLDLAGHRKYQRTTLAGICCSQPLGAILVISSITGLSQTSIEHIQLIHALHLPMIIVLTKIDLLSVGLEQTKRIDSIRLHLAHQFEKIENAYPKNERSNGFYLPNMEMPPIFPLSNVTGQGLDELLHFLGHFGNYPSIGKDSPPMSLSKIGYSVLESMSHKLDPDNDGGGEAKHLTSATNPGAQLCNANSLENVVNQINCKFKHRRENQLTRTELGMDYFLFWITQVFTQIPNVPNPVLVGRIQLGHVEVGHKLWLGPNQVGKFERVEIVSLMHNRQSYQTVYAGQSASMAINFTDSMDQSLEFKRQFSLDRFSQFKQSDFVVNLSKSAFRTAVVWSVKMKVKSYFPIGSFKLENSSQGKSNLFPLRGQQVHIYAGCVYQTTVIVSNSSETMDTNELMLRFVRHPEFIELGRSCILTWNGNLKVIGFLIGFGDQIIYSYDVDDDNNNNNNNNSNADDDDDDNVNNKSIIDSCICSTNTHLYNPDSNLSNLYERFSPASQDSFMFSTLSHQSLDDDDKERYYSCCSSSPSHSIKSSKSDPYELMIENQGDMKMLMTMNLMSSKENVFNEMIMKKNDVTILDEPCNNDKNKNNHDIKISYVNTTTTNNNNVSHSKSHRTFRKCKGRRRRK